MSYFIDNFAKSIATAADRRTILQRFFTYPLVGGVASLIGLTPQAAIAACSACTACDLDTKKCGLSCKPASAGTTICTNSAQDGTYLRIANYLTRNGFSANGIPKTMLFYKSAKPYLSTLIADYKNATSPNMTAKIFYTVSAQGDILCYGMVFDNKIPNYAIIVDPSGRIQKKYATKQLKTPPSGGKTAVLSNDLSKDRSDTSGNISSAPAVPSIDLGTCEDIIDVICNLSTGVQCYFFVAAFCAATGPGAIVCQLALGALCGLAGQAACNNTKALVCACDFNHQKCADVCCDECHDCLNNKCVPKITCGSNACCDGICCEPGYTCQGGVCTSPNSRCVGATCDTFVPCSTNPDCVCVTLASGGGLCFPGSTPCAGLTKCNDAPCPAGYLCAIGTCCRDSVCVPISGQCPAQPSGAMPKISVPTSVLTIGRRAQ